MFYNILEKEIESLQISNSQIEQEKLSQHRRINMFRRLVYSPDAFFKSQQRGDPDLTDDEKYKIVEDIFEKDPKKFLERYGKFLIKEDVGCLDSLPSNDLVDCYKKQIIEQLSQKPSNSSTKNRRYNKMMSLLKEGEYFSDDEMKKRNPLMYQRMVGNFLNVGDINTGQSLNENFLSSFCMSHLQVMQNNELYKKQVEEEETYMDCMSEEDEDEMESEEEEEEEENDEKEEPGEKPQVINSMKNDLRRDFTDIMKERFLQGKDEEINYEEIDNDERSDSFDVINQDAEDKYFDDDKEEW